MPENLKFYLFVQADFQTTVHYKKNHISQTVKEIRLKFYEHAHKEISNNFVIHFTAQF
jgi:hypothetical protein